MRRFTFRPSLTLSGRTFKGLRGWAGKPLHPPLTDVPVGAYVIAAVLDIFSLAVHAGHARLATEMFHAAGWAFLAGAAVSVLAALTGWADWHRSSEPGTQARRTINAHAITMITVTVLALIDIVLRFTTARTDEHSPVWLVVLTVVVAGLLTLGATIGGSLVYDYGFNVETAGDSPVWHHSEADVLPGQKAAGAEHSTAS